MASGRPKPRAIFTEGSILRHVLVMTATGSIGLIAVFVVDLLSLLYISRLGDTNLTAGVGYASQILFVVVSINIGLSIAVSALVSRRLGGSDRPGAQRIAASGLIHVLIVSGLLAIPIFIWRVEILSRIGASGVALDTASLFLAFTLPANPLMAGGMALSGVLRAVGDAKRAMYVTLIGAVVTAVLDPILIFGLHLGVTGAAITTVVSRVVWMVVGVWGAVHIHGLIGRPTRAAVMRDLKPVMLIALPVILTNLAAPVANIYSMRIFSQFGTEVVAAFAIIDRVTPVAFGVLFAMSGSVGPIVGQNFGARNYGRVRQTLNNCYAVAATYVLCIWGVLFFGAPGINSLFGAHGETAELVTFFCHWGAAAWFFLGCIFTANAAFNNLGFPVLSTVFNWGRATLGTIPFVTIGARMWGPEGGLIGIVAGAALFGVFAVGTSYWATNRLASRAAKA
jgi:putative MATE family efflux protein